MLSISHVLGSRLEPAFSEKILRLEHHNAVDEVRLSGEELERHQLRTTTRNGQELAISLPRHQRLFDGAVLLLDEVSAIVVRVAGERWLRLEPRSISDAISSATTSAIWAGGWSASRVRCCSSPSRGGQRTMLFASANCSGRAGSE
ncbi:MULTISPECIES: hypothetical protein [unclassified Bradyrhizobium]|uniref:hypothetical protein n=1 Tax=unclassified Bradyrhizobium TaxID=2631580 RepID=UPI0028969068|nr:MULTISPECIES: hypothetical protein [unclassified Bradyrhizobium]